MNRVAVLWILASATVARPSLGQSEAEIQAELQKLCQTVLCREPAQIRLQLPDGERFDVPPTSPTPIIAGDLITVYPGETIRVEAKVEGNRLVGLTAVS